jgi:hypothetical protein
MRIRSTRNLKGWSRRQGRHLFDKRRPFKDQRFSNMTAALLMVFPEDSAMAMLAEYQMHSHKRGHIYNLSMLAILAQTTRGAVRASLCRVLTHGHHTCFNLAEI